MRAVVLVSVAAIACTDAPGLTLRVQPGDSNVTKLRVLVSDRTCSANTDPESTSEIPPDCSGIALDPTTGEVQGHIRFVNDGSADDGLVAVDPVQAISSDHDFVVRLLPNPGGAARFTHVALIGFDDADTAYSIAEMTFGSDAPIPSAPTYEQVTLESLDAAGGAAVHVQPGSGAGDYVCVQIDNAPDAQSGSVTTEFYVPVEDPDCDGIPLENECKPYEASFSGTFGGADSDVATCSTLDTLHTGCVLGAGVSSCRDGSGAAPAPAGCVPVDATAPAPCVPDPMCSGACGSSLDPAACFGANFEAVQGMTHMECSVQTGANGPCDAYFDPGTGVLGAVTGSGACDLQLTEITSPITLDGFSAQAQFFDAQGQPAGGQVQITNNPPSNFPSMCGLGMQLPGDAMTSIAYIRLTTPNSTGSVVLPILLQLPPAGTPLVDCSQTPSTCTVVGGQDGEDQPYLLGCVGITDVGSDGSGSGSGSSGTARLRAVARRRAGSALQRVVRVELHRERRARPR